MARVCADPRFPMALAASQVNQVQLGLPQVLVAEGISIDDLQVHGEDGVGTRRVSIHGSCGCYSEILNDY